MRRFFRLKNVPPKSEPSPGSDGSPRDIDSLGEVSGGSIFGEDRMQNLSWEKILGAFGSPEYGEPYLFVGAKLSTSGLVHIARGRDGKKYVVKIMARFSPSKQKAEKRVRSTVIERGDLLAAQNAGRNSNEETKPVSRIEYQKYCENFYREKSVLEVVCHPNIPKLLKECPSGVDTINTHCMILDYAEGVDLFDLLECYDIFPVNLARKIYRDILITMRFVHSQGFYHRDLKLENVIYDPRTDKIKIIDWKLAEDEVMSKAEPSGSIYYVAPEVVVSSRSLNHTGPVNDIWSATIILYVLLCKEMPYDITSTERDFDSPTVAEKILGDTLGYQIRYDRTFLPPDAIPFLKSIFVVYTHRPTINLILESEWMNKAIREREYRIVKPAVSR